MWKMQALQRRKPEGNAQAQPSNSQQHCK